MTQPKPASSIRDPAAAPILEVALPGGAAALVELLVLHAYATDRIGWLVLVAAHLLIVALLALWTAQLAHAGRNCAMPLLTTIAAAAAGPVGALAAIGATLLVARKQDDPKLLADWYERIAMATETDDVTRLCEQVATGRTASLNGEPPRSFGAVMERGTLDERQATLGIIARSFHPDYLPVLMLALKSPEPVIRVQAAAVATRVRGNLRALVDRHALDLPTVAGNDATAALAAAAQLQGAIASGLLDEGDRLRAGVIVERLAAQGRALRAAHSIAPMPILDRQVTETMLLDQHRFGELRVARRIAAVADAGHYRVRRARRPVSAGVP